MSAEVGKVRAHRGDGPPTGSIGVEGARLTVAMAAFVGAGFVFYFAATIPSLPRDSPVMAPWYMPVAIVLAFGPGAALLVAALLRGGAAWIPRLAVLTGVGFAASALLWFVSWTGDLLPAEQLPWLMNFTGLSGVAVALVSLPWALGVLVTNSLLAASVSVLVTTGEVAVGQVVSAALWAVVFTLPFLIATRMVVRTGDLLDETRAEVIRTEAAILATAARSTERMRFDAMIHDRVIATLVAANAHSGDPRLPDQAAVALAEMDRLESGDRDAEEAEDSEIGAAEAVVRLRTFAAAVDPGVDAVVGGAEGLERNVPRYPVGAVRVLSEAMGEALRNSIRHAGPAAERVLLVETNERSLLVTVADDGCGFNPDHVPPERLGIELSIRARLAELLGGSAEVNSLPGRGTIVQIRWESPS